MRRRRQVALVGAVVGVAVVGVLFSMGYLSANSSPSADSLTSGVQTTDTNTGGRASQRAIIKIKPRRFKPDVTGPNNTTLRVNVNTQVYGYGGVNYNNLQLCAYDRNGTLLQREPLGTISTNPPPELYKTFRVNLTVQIRPHYLIVDHPRLRNDSRFFNQIRYWNGETYTLTYESLDEIQNQFEWPRTNETGTCG